MAGLRYVLDDDPGIRRRRCGRGFTYLHPDGGTVRDPELRRRLEDLAIPPAWTDVWICPDELGHLQATGRDDRNRKQYLYHEQWSATRNRLKFRRLVAFGHALPALRRRVGRDLSREGIPPDRILAAAVRLLDRAAIRIGSREYAERNGSFGLATLRTRHAEIDGATVRLRFQGKGGSSVEIDVRDRGLADAMGAALEVPGWELFQLVDDEGTKRSVEPDDVTAYVRRLAGGPFSAKDFRTWHATVGVVRRLPVETNGGEGTRLSSWLASVDAVAERLCNTRAVVRLSYLPPDLESLWMEGRFADRVASVQDRVRELAEPGRARGEGLTLALLETLDTPGEGG